MLDELIGQSATIGARKDSYLSKPVHMVPNTLNVRSTGSSFAQNHQASQSTTQRAATAASHVAGTGKQKLESFVTPRKDQLIFMTNNIGNNKRPTSSKGAEISKK
jgi:hypothetical protein